MVFVALFTVKCVNCVRLCICFLVSFSIIALFLVQLNSFGCEQLKRKLCLTNNNNCYQSKKKLFVQCVCRTIRASYFFWFLFLLRQIVLFFLFHSAVSLSCVNCWSSRKSMSVNKYISKCNKYVWSSMCAANRTHFDRIIWNG